ncbi:hypothetical protein CERSUDRAFT_119787, partial [Gelatoporia subvermispora B]
MCLRIFIDVPTGLDAVRKAHSVLSPVITPFWTSFKDLDTRTLVSWYCLYTLQLYQHHMPS